MNTEKSTPSLTRGDLMEMDAQLFAELRRVIPCTGCALYFPTEAPARQPELLAGERRLLLPLWRGETPLAVAMLHGVRVRALPGRSATVGRDTDLWSVSGRIA